MAKNLDNLGEVLEQQSDLTKVKSLETDRPVCFYRVTQCGDKGDKKQLVQVLDNLHNHYTIKRQKDLLHYFNQFKSFTHFNEIRKVGKQYLLFFNDPGKQTLQTYVHKKEPLAVERVEKLLANMVSVLDKVHRVGFVHSAISPDTIFAGKKRFYLMDWRQAMPALSAYESEILPKDNRYTPPERLNGQHDEKGDIYQLGCTLYFALTGKHIYRLNKVKNPMDQMWAQARHSIHKINRLPVFWRYLIVWMTDKNPQNRPSLTELKAWIKTRTVPEWVRKKTFESYKSYPQDTMLALADAHYLYAIYQQAQQLEEQGDLDSAFNLYESCAFRSYSLAEVALAKMYQKGIRIEISLPMAAHLFQQAYQKGHPEAAYCLAEMFECGEGLQKNLQKAFRLYEFAALRGNLHAQHKIGDMLMHGQGTQAHEEQAVAWLRMAAQSGHQAASLKLVELKL